MNILKEWFCEKKKGCILNYEMLVCLKRKRELKFCFGSGHWHMMWPIDVMFKSILFGKAKHVFEIIVLKVFANVRLGSAGTS